MASCDGRGCVDKECCPEGTLESDGVCVARAAEDTIAEDVGSDNANNNKFEIIQDSSAENDLYEQPANMGGCTSINSRNPWNPGAILITILVFACLLAGTGSRRMKRH